MSYIIRLRQLANRCLRINLLSHSRELRAGRSVASLYSDFSWLYVRYFPAISQYMGYGSVEDRAATVVAPVAGIVTLYTGLGCPFCPIVKCRLTELQSKMSFELREVDITFKPELLISKGIRTLPVIEIGAAKWVGNGTSLQLAQFISEHAAPISGTSPTYS